MKILFVQTLGIYGTGPSLILKAISKIPDATFLNFDAHYVHTLLAHDGTYDELLNKVGQLSGKVPSPLGSEKTQELIDIFKQTLNNQNDLILVKDLIFSSEDLSAWCKFFKDEVFVIVFQDMESPQPDEYYELQRAVIQSGICHDASTSLSALIDQITNYFETIRAW